MRLQIVITSILSCMIVTSALLPGKAAYGQQTGTIVGKVVKIDLESGVINVETGAVTKEAFSGAHLDADILWEELIKHGYIDHNGTIQAPFYLLDKFSSMLLSKKFNPKKKLIYTVFQNALTDNGQTMLFYIALDSDLLRGTHQIASVEIEQGDPVTIHYNSSSEDKNNIIRLVDDKPE